MPLSALLLCIILLALEFQNFHYLKKSVFLRNNEQQSNNGSESKNVSRVTEKLILPCSVLCVSVCVCKLVNECVCECLGVKTCAITRLGVEVVTRRIAQQQEGH